MAVAGSGPALPQPLSKAPGTITGRLVRHGEPVADAVIEICVEKLGMMFRGDSPCASQQVSYRATTEADGNFILEDVPTGNYVFTFKEGNSWTRLSEGMFGFTTSRILVEPGQETSIGELETAS